MKFFKMINGLRGGNPPAPTTDPNTVSIRPIADPDAASTVSTPTPSSNNSRTSVQPGAAQAQRLTTAAPSQMEPRAQDALLGELSQRRTPPARRDEILRQLRPSMRSLEERMAKNIHDEAHPIHAEDAVRVHRYQQALAQRNHHDSSSSTTPRSSSAANATTQPALAAQAASASPAAPTTPPKQDAIRATEAFMGHLRDENREVASLGTNPPLGRNVNDPQGLAAARDASRLSAELADSPTGLASDVNVWRRRLDATHPAGQAANSNSAIRAEHHGEMMEILQGSSASSTESASAASANEPLESQRQAVYAEYRDDLARVSSNPQLSQQRLDEVLADPELREHIRFDQLSADLRQISALQERYDAALQLPPDQSRQALLEIFGHYTSPDLRHEAGAEQVRTALHQSVQPNDPAAMHVMLDAQMLPAVRDSGMPIEARVLREGTASAIQLRDQNTQLGPQPAQNAFNVMQATRFFELSGNAAEQATSLGVLAEQRSGLRAFARDAHQSVGERADASQRLTQVDLTLLDADVQAAQARAVTDSAQADYDASDADNVTHASGGPSGRAEASLSRASLEARYVGELRQRVRDDFELANASLNEFHSNSAGQREAHLPLEREFRATVLESRTLQVQGQPLFEPERATRITANSAQRISETFAEHLTQAQGQAALSPAEQGMTQQHFDEFLAQAHPDQVRSFSAASFDSFADHSRTVQALESGNVNMPNLSRALADQGFEGLPADQQRNVMRGMIYGEMGLRERASQAYGQAQDALIAQPDQNIQSLYRLGQLYQSSGQLAGNHSANAVFGALARISPPSGNSPADVRTREIIALSSARRDVNLGNVDSAIASLRASSGEESRNLEGYLVGQRNAANSQRALGIFSSAIAARSLYETQHGGMSDETGRIRSQWGQFLQRQVQSGASLEQALNAADQANPDFAREREHLLTASPHLRDLIALSQPGLSNARAQDGVLSWAQHLSERTSGDNRNPDNAYISVVDEALREVADSSTGVGQADRVRAATLYRANLGWTQDRAAVQNSAIRAVSSITPLTAVAASAYFAASAPTRGEALREVGHLAAFGVASRIAGGVVAREAQSSLAGSLAHGTIMSGVNSVMSHHVDMATSALEGQRVDYSFLPQHFARDLAMGVPLMAASSYTQALRRSALQANPNGLSVASSAGLAATELAAPVLAGAAGNMIAQPQQDFTDALRQALDADIHARQQGAAVRGVEHAAEAAPSPEELRRQVQGGLARARQVADQVGQNIPQPLRTGVGAGVGALAYASLTGAMNGGEHNALPIIAGTVVAGAIVGAVRGRGRGPVFGRPEGSEAPRLGVPTSPSREPVLDRVAGHDVNISDFQFTAVYPERVTEQSFMGGCRFSPDSTRPGQLNVVVPAGRTLTVYRDEVNSAGESPAQTLGAGVHGIPPGTRFSIGENAHFVNRAVERESTPTRAVPAGQSVGGALATPVPASLRPGGMQLGGLGQGNTEVSVLSADAANRANNPAVQSPPTPFARESTSPHHEVMDGHLSLSREGVVNWAPSADPFAPDVRLYAVQANGRTQPLPHESSVRPGQVVMLAQNDSSTGLPAGNHSQRFLVEPNGQLRSLQANEAVISSQQLEAYFQNGARVGGQGGRFIMYVGERNFEVSEEVYQTYNNYSERRALASSVSQNPLSAEFARGAQIIQQGDHYILQARNSGGESRIASPAEFSLFQNWQRERSMGRSAQQNPAMYVMRPVD